MHYYAEIVSKSRSQTQSTCCHRTTMISRMLNLFNTNLASYICQYCILYLFILSYFAKIFFSYIYLHYFEKKYMTHTPQTQTARQINKIKVPPCIFVCNLSTLQYHFQSSLSRLRWRNVWISVPEIIHSTTFTVQWICVTYRQRARNRQIDW